MQQRVTWKHDQNGRKNTSSRELDIAGEQGNIRMHYHIHLLKAKLVLEELGELVCATAGRLHVVLAPGDVQPAMNEVQTGSDVFGLEHRKMQPAQFALFLGDAVDAAGAVLSGRGVAEGCAPVRMHGVVRDLCQRAADVDCKRSHAIKIFHLPLQG